MKLFQKQKTKPIQFFFERHDGNKSISGILDVDTLEGLADSIEDFLKESPEQEIIIHKVVRGSIL